MTTKRIKGPDTLAGYVKDGVNPPAADLNHSSKELTRELRPDRGCITNKIVALEGIDGIGKTTITNLLKTCLEEDGHKAITLSCPSDRSILELEEGLTRELAFIKDRREVYRKAKALHAQGYWVIIDRFWMSGIAYCQDEEMLDLHYRERDEFPDVHCVVLHASYPLDCWFRQTKPRVPFAILREANNRYLELGVQLNNLEDLSLSDTHHVIVSCFDAPPSAIAADIYLDLTGF